MSARSFLDTNVLLYTDSADAPTKRKQALGLLSEHRLARTGVVSLQVLQEYFVAATR
jgi:predicted nucleic acid-binding protein